MRYSRKLLGALAASSVSLMAVDAALAQDNPTDNMTTVTDEMLLNPPEGDWLMWRRTYDGWGYSPLDQINADNVSELELVWSWGMSPGRNQQTPVVHDGVMYIQNADHTFQALNAATGDLIWELEYELAEGVSPNGERSMAIYGDNLYVATRDNHVLAIDFRSGQLVWDTLVAEAPASGNNYSQSSGPLVANGVVIQGTTGCGGAQPGGCFITGLDAASGEILWRVNTIAQGDDPNDATWNGVPVESRFGASAWITASYDPVQNLFFQGVGQVYPWNVEMAGLVPQNPDYTNEALYTNSTLAIDATTGELMWYHQYLPTDSLDLDYVYERLLIDLPFNGETRQMVVTTGKIGIIEAIDRVTGEWLWAVETVPQNVVLSIDENGIKTINPEVIPVIGETTFNCPADPGGRAWQATAYSPLTQTLYLPTAEFCSNTTVNPLDEGAVYTGGGRQTYARVPVPDSDGNIGQVRAVSLVDLTETWQYRQRVPITTSTLPTGGGLVFAGSLDRRLLALDDETGELLWSSPRLINSLESFPITYEVDGRQYIAVGTNWASGLGRLASLTPEEQLPPNNPIGIFVFALPED